MNEKIREKMKSLMEKYPKDFEKVYVGWLAERKGSVEQTYKKNKDGTVSFKTSWGWVSFKPKELK